MSFQLATIAPRAHERVGAQILSNFVDDFFTFPVDLADCVDLDAGANVLG